MQVDDNYKQQNLTEAQQYYIGLFERWQKMSMDESVKLDNPKLWQRLNATNYSLMIQDINDEEDLNMFTKDFINNLGLQSGILSEILLSSRAWFRRIITLTILDNKLEKLKLLNLNLNAIASFPDQFSKLLQLQKQNRLEIINCINYAELENEQLKNELELIKKPELSNSKFKVFHFNQDILGEYKASLAEYFMGLKDFILYAQGKSIGVNIEVNGTLDVKIYSDSEQDLEIVKESIQDYIFNLKKTGNDLQIHTGVGAKVDGQKALIHLQSKINSLQTSLQLKNSNLLQAKNQLVFLESVIEDLTNNNAELKISNQKLLIDLDYAIAQIDNLKNELTKIKTQNLYKNLNQNHLDNIINLLGSLSLVIEQKNDEGLVKQLVNKLADYEKVNREFLIKINLPKINLNLNGVQIDQDFSTINLSDIIQQITIQLYRKY